MCLIRTFEIEAQFTRFGSAVPKRENRASLLITLQEPIEINLAHCPELTLWKSGGAAKKALR
jgi:hypothetical protein